MMKVKPRREEPPQGPEADVCRLAHICENMVLLGTEYCDECEESGLADRHREKQ